MLKECNTVVDCGVTPCVFAIVPVMVKVNPQGTLWNEDNPDPRAADFQNDTLAQIVRLSSSAMNQIGYEVDLANDAGQSLSSFGFPFIDDYTAQMNSAVAATFRAGLATGSLTADQMARRALTQSCAGCHMPPTFGLNAPNSIGTVTTPPGSITPTIDSWPGVVGSGFAHVNTPTTILPELAANPAAFGTGEGQEISPALLGFFLPDRKNFLLGELNKARCLCRPRFRFLDAALRRRAFEIEAKVEKQFGPRLEAIEKKLTEARSIKGEEAGAALDREKAQLLAEREKTLTAELSAAGIKPRDEEQVDLRVQPMKLRAGAAAKGDARRAAALRIDEVNRLLRAEPPRRTVTGSFRAH
jgi:hypothetical protein